MSRRLPPFPGSGRSPPRRSWPRCPTRQCSAADGSSRLGSGWCHGRTRPAARPGSAGPAAGRRLSPSPAGHRRAVGAVVLQGDQGRSLDPGAARQAPAARGGRRVGQQDGTDRLGAMARQTACCAYGTRPQRKPRPSSGRLQGKEHDGVVGCTDGSGEAWRREGSRARGSVEVPIRGTHRGLRSVPTANEAGHMVASNPPQQTLSITLAGRGPSTHGFSRRPTARPRAAVAPGKARRCPRAWR